MGICQRLIGIDAAGKDDQRNTVLMGVGNGVDPIQNPRSQSSNQDAGRAGAVPDPLGHEGGGVLMARQCHLDSGPCQRIHHGQNLTARHAKGMAAPRLVKTPCKIVGGAVFGLSAISHGADSSVVLRTLWRSGRATASPVRGAKTGGTLVFPPAPP